MMKHGINAPRPARDELEVPLEFEPDTPMHHSFRPSNTAWKHKLVGGAQVLIAFLLVAAAGVWFFIDVEDLHHRSRFEQSSMNTAQSFPDGYMGVQDISITRSRALSRAESLGVYVDEHEDEKLTSISAKQRWASKLESITVQPLVQRIDPPSRDSKVVLLTSQCCGETMLSEVEASKCNQHLMGACSATADIHCFVKAATQPPCNVQSMPTPSYKNSYLASLKRAIPFLRELGWSALEVYPNIFSSADNSNCSLEEADKQAIMQGISNAKLILTDMDAAKSIWKSNAEARLVILDTSTSSVLSSDSLDVLADERVLSIWRAQTLTNGTAQNGPLLADSAHLATLKGASDDPEYRKVRQAKLPESVINKITPTLSHVQRYRHPLDCGGNQQHVRFVGAFEQNSSHWMPLRMVDRKIDIAYMPSLTPAADLTGLTAGAQKLVMSHRNRLTKVLQDMQSIHPELSIEVTSSNSGAYEEYLQQLQDTKILITPGNANEWSEQDFDAIFMGCLLMKVDPASFQTYPAIFEPGDYVLRAGTDWEGVPETLMTALKDLEHVQRMADRTVNRMLELSDMRRYAADIDEHLSLLTQTLAA